MADLSITAANVIQVSGNTTQALAGVAVTAGMSAYIDTSGLVQKADALTSAVTAACTGVVLNNAAIGQPVTIQTNGNITIGATLTVGALYVTSGANAGGIAPVADLTTGWRTQVFGVAISTTVLTLVLQGGSPLTAHS